jgi:hypothetical protein
MARRGPNWQVLDKQILVLDMGAIQGLRVTRGWDFVLKAWNWARKVSVSPLKAEKTTPLS